jgi:hypothetical protein
VAPTFVFAHAGHWLAGLGYFSPVLVLIGLIMAGKIKDRRTDG